MTPLLKATVFIATSLDGFIAREKGELDWLPTEADASGEDYGYGALLSSVDALVMGRHTFEKVLSFRDLALRQQAGGGAQHAGADDSGTPGDSVECMAGAPQEIVARLAARGYRSLYIDGGLTIQRFSGGRSDSTAHHHADSHPDRTGNSAVRPTAARHSAASHRDAPISHRLVQSEYEVVA